MKEVDDCIAKTIPPYNRDDFKQDLFLILIAKDPEQILKLYESNQLKSYCVGIIVRQAYQSRSAYNTTYKDKTVEMPDNIEIEESEYIEPPEITMEMLQEVDKRFKTESNYPVYTKLFELLNRCRSMREASRLTGISVSAISRMVKKLRTHIKEKQ